MRRFGSVQNVCAQESGQLPVEASVKTRANAGFTLVETLLSLAILVLLTGLVAMGIPAASNSYSKTVDSSNAQVVLTNATTALRNELGMASNWWPRKDDTGKSSNVVQAIYTSEGYIAQFRNSQEGKLVNPNPVDGEGASATEDAAKERDGVIEIDYYAGSSEASEPVNSDEAKLQGTRELVPDAAISDKLVLKLDKYDTGAADDDPTNVDITYDEDKQAFIVKGIRVFNQDGTELASVENFEVKAVMMENENKEGQEG